MSTVINLTELSPMMGELEEVRGGARGEHLSLDDVPCGQLARVVSVGGSGAAARRLMEMGVLPGAPVRVVRAAPWGDPIQICVRHYQLALRRTEARTITVITDDVLQV